MQLTHSQEHGIFKLEIIDLRQHARRDGGVGTNANRADIGHRVCPGEGGGGVADEPLRHYYRGMGGVRRCARCSAAAQTRVNGCFVTCET